MEFVWILGLLAVSSASGLRSPKYAVGTATAYNGPNGLGSEGGACGYTSLVHASGYNKRETAASDELFAGGLGCGRCFKVRCCYPSICRNRSITVIVMDQAPPGDGSGPRFDISGTAFDMLALDGQSENLRAKGVIGVAWKWTACRYGGKTITFRVMAGSTVDWFSLLVEFESGDGDVGSMKIKGVSSDYWQDMTQVWGASWWANIASLQGPFSIQLTSSSGNTKQMNDVIPIDWVPLGTYKSKDNF